MIIIKLKIKKSILYSIVSCILYNINNPTKPPIVPLVVELKVSSEDNNILIQNNIVNNSP